MIDNTQCIFAECEGMVLGMSLVYLSYEMPLVLRGDVPPLKWTEVPMCREHLTDPVEEEGLLVWRNNDRAIIMPAKYSRDEILDKFRKGQ